MYAENTVLVVGQAKPSREDAIYNLHGEFYISLVVERDTGRILDVDCNTILSVTKNFVASMFVGKNLRTDTEVLEREIKERYFALTQKPLIACMKDAHNRYMMACQGPRQVSRDGSDWPSPRRERPPGSFLAAGPGPGHPAFYGQKCRIHARSAGGIF